MHGRLERKHGLKVEVLGKRKETAVVRLYSAEHGWVYGKLNDDASIDEFARKAKAPRSSRKVTRV